MLIVKYVMQCQGWLYFVKQTK